MVDWSTSSERKAAEEQEAREEELLKASDGDSSKMWRRIRFVDEEGGLGI